MAKGKRKRKHWHGSKQPHHLTGIEARNEVVRLRSELKHARRQAWIPIVGKIIDGISSAFWPTAFVLVIYFLAGKNTNADVNIDMGILGQSTSEITCRVAGALSMLAAFLGIRYGRRQQAEKQRTIQQMSAHQQALERRLDPNRSTSALMPTGETRPEDK